MEKYTPPQLYPIKWFGDEGWNTPLQLELRTAVCSLTPKPTRKCDHPQCNKQVEIWRKACGQHWYQLPKSLQASINRAHYQSRKYFDNPKWLDKQISELNAKAIEIWKSKEAQT